LTTTENVLGELWSELDFAREYFLKGWAFSMHQEEQQIFATRSQSTLRIVKRRASGLAVISVSCLLAFPLPILAQSNATNRIPARTFEKEASRIAGVDPAEERRAFAISLVISLGNEARSYFDLALRSRVLARAADVVWNSDNVTGQALFRRAWEAAEKGDVEDVTVKTKDNPPAMVIALRRMSGRDLRSEVLSMVARRDRALSEEFLTKLKSSTDRETEDSKSRPRSGDGWSTSEAISKRLQVAKTLLDDGQVERALEFAGPALDQVNASSIAFLCALRAKNPEAADQRFALLLARAELDPLSDANTVSGLSSYAFSPGFYVTFSADGGAIWSPGDPVSPPNLPPAIRNRFFEAAASILLRPLPPPDQDFTSSGRTGKSKVIRRLLPLFDLYAPDTATALRAQLAALTGNSSTNTTNSESPLLTQGIKPEDNAGTVLEKMQDRLDHAKSSQERDEICAAAAVTLATKDDLRARDVAEKIDDSDRRAEVRQYVDFELVQLAIQKKKGLEAARLAKTGQLTHTQRAWAYTQAARLLLDSQRERAFELLQEATDETQRVDGTAPDRALLLVGVARQLITADRVRAWQIMDEAVRAANAAESFTGENELISSLWTKSGVKFTSIGGEDSGLSPIFRSLANDDLYRSIDLAKSFKNDAPRAAATLAIASALLEKQAAKTSNN
jgi:hypothetical protein